MVPLARDPDESDANPVQTEGRAWARRREGFREATIQSASVLMATGGVMPIQVKAAISDCSYTSIEAEMRHLLSRREAKPAGLPIPAGVLFSAVRKAALRRTGCDLRDAAPIEAVVHSRTPTLFIHGVEDDFVPASMMGKLYQTAQCRKSFLWVPGAGHAAAVGTDWQLY